MSESVDEAGFLKRLADIGIQKDRLAELISGPNDYEHALPLILDHVGLIHGRNAKETQGLREILIRSLAIPAAKKLPDLWPRLMEMFTSSADLALKWAIGNTLEVIAKNEHLAEVIRVLSDPAHKNAREPFCRAARKLKSPRFVPPLVAILHEKRAIVNPDSSEFPYGRELSPVPPIEALGSIAGPEVIRDIEPFLSDCYPGTQTPDPSVRTEARKAIDRIRKRSSSTA